jgi:hypothetical protein
MAKTTAPKPNRLRLVKVTVQSHLIEETAGGEVIGEHFTEPMTLYTTTQLHTYADELPLAIKQYERELAKQRT